MIIVVPRKTKRKYVGNIELEKLMVAVTYIADNLPRRVHDGDNFHRHDSGLLVSSKKLGLEVRKRGKKRCVLIQILMKWRKGRGGRATG